MVERQHRVGFAPAEVGLQLHHGIAALPRDALYAAHQQTLQALGQECATEELLGLLVLVRALAEMHLPEVGGKLGLLVTPARDVGVRRYNLPPRLESSGRRSLDQRAPDFALLTP